MLRRRVKTVCLFRSLYSVRACRISRKIKTAFYRNKVVIIKLRCYHAYSVYKLYSLLFGMFKWFFPATWSNRYWNWNLFLSRSHTHNIWIFNENLFFERLSLVFLITTDILNKLVSSLVRNSRQSISNITFSDNTKYRIFTEKINTR